MASFIDTHCHIHDAAFGEKFAGKEPDEMISEARTDGVEHMICVGTDLESSVQAVSFCADRPMCSASVALHPHEAEKLSEDELRRAMKTLYGVLSEQPERLVAIGECGLDYFYHDDEDTRQKQELLLRMHLDYAQEFDLPLIFHVRDAFEEFFRIFDEYKGLRGVVHSFSATQRELDGVISRGLYIGLNGIMTFTKLPEQLDAARQAPLERIVLETDAPFLTPAPFRGKMCEPKHVVCTAQFLCDLRGETIEDFGRQTTENARRLFGLK